MLAYCFQLKKQQKREHRGILGIHPELSNSMKNIIQIKVRNVTSLPTANAYILYMFRFWWQMNKNYPHDYTKGN